MRKRKTFTITEDHLKLLRHAYTSWYSAEYGAPTIDPKRPYGDSNVHRSMVKALGWPTHEDQDGDYPKEITDKLDQLHQDLETVLQIIFRNLSVKTGTYIADEYGTDWRLPQTSEE